MRPCVGRFCSKRTSQVASVCLKALDIGEGALLKGVDRGSVCESCIEGSIESAPAILQLFKFFTFCIEFAVSLNST
ncbi:MAG: hypothetical protein AAF709_22685, partial [Pseudomonadota bacterium]